MAQETEIGGLVVKVRADLSEYIKKLEEMEKETDDKSNKVAKSLDKIGTGLAKIGIGLGMVAGLAAKSAMDWGAAVNDMVDKTGMAGEEASKLLAITNRVGVSAEETGTMFSRFSRAAYDAAQAQETMKAGGAEATDAFTTMGISVTNLDGTMKSSSALFGEVKTLIADMPAGLQKTALEMEFFGRAGTKMNDMLNMTQTEMDETIKRAQDMGLIMSTEASAAWEQFSFELNTTKLSLTSLGVSFGNELLPALKSLLADAQGITQAFVLLDPETRKNIISMASFGAEVGIAYTILGKSSGVILDVAKALGVLKASTIAAAGPWGILAFTIGTAVVALGDYKKAQMGNEGQNLTIEGEDGQEYEVKNPYYKSKTDNADFKRMQEGTSNEELARLQAERSASKYKVSAPGIGGASGTGTDKSAYEQYKQDTQDLISLWQKQVELEQISNGELAANIRGRLDGLSDVVVLDKEIVDSESFQADLQVSIKNARAAATAEAISGIEKVTAANKISLASQEEDARHAIALAGIVADNTLTAKLELLARQEAATQESLKQEYLLQLNALNEKLSLYDIESKAYKELLAERQNLNDNYYLNAKKADNDYQERVAAETEKTNEEIRQTWADTLTGIIAGGDDVKNVFKNLGSGLLDQLLGGKGNSLSKSIFGNLGGKKKDKDKDTEKGAISASSLKDGNKKTSAKKGSSLGGGKKDENEEATEGFNEGLITATDAAAGLAETLTGNSEITQALNAAKVIEQGVSMIMGSAVKPAETASTTTTTASIISLGSAAASAAIALQSIRFAGLYEHGGIVPSAAKGMVTPSTGILPGNGIPSILHPREMVLPANISSFIMGTMDMVNSRGGGFGGGKHYTSITINGAKMNDDTLVKKIGKVVKNTQRGRTG